VIPNPEQFSQKGATRPRLGLSTRKQTRSSRARREGKPFKNPRKRNVSVARTRWNALKEKGGAGGGLLLENVEGLPARQKENKPAPQKDHIFTALKKSKGKVWETSAMGGEKGCCIALKRGRKNTIQGGGLPQKPLGKSKPEK